jgi:hypothetical protein
VHSEYEKQGGLIVAKIQKEDARKYLADVPGEYVFRSHDSSIFKNMRELRDGLANMAEETYAYHANAEKNDFSNWIRDIIKDDKLAAELKSAKSRAEAAKRVGNRIAILSRW